MKVSPLAIADVVLFEPEVFGDDRGFFMVSFNQHLFNEAVGYEVNFVQDNHSHSKKAVLRGLHYQLPPHAQGKLVRVVSGAVFDVAVDMRRRSPSFGKWVGEELSAANARQLWIPPGFAHGFLVLTDSADFLYKTTNYHAPHAEVAVRWDDSSLAIDWPGVGVAPLVSSRDAVAKKLSCAPTFD